MRSRLGRRPVHPRTTTTLAAAWAIIAAFLAALGAQALAQAAHDHPAPTVCAGGADHHGPSDDPHHRHGTNPCPVCEKTSLAKLSLAPPAPPAALVIPARPAATPAWHPAAEAESLPVRSARARGPPRAA